MMLVVAIVSLVKSGMGLDCMQKVGHQSSI